MIEVKLYHDVYHSMAQDKTLEPFFPINSAVLASKMSYDQFDEFLKRNNLITIRHHLKSYQDGKICGEFSET